MSKLPNAPLNEVIFELKWDVTNKQTLQKNQYLHGDLHAELKRKFPHRELLVPYEVPYETFINRPTHRFRVKEEGYPIYQVGPGLITYNTVDEFYYWDQFKEDAEEIIQKFIATDVFPGLQIRPALHYIDFFGFDFTEQNIFDFVNKNFKINIKHSFIETKENPDDINLGFNFPSDLGAISVIFQKGNSARKGSGLLLQTRITGSKMKLDEEIISKWLSESHETLSKLFKDIVKPSFYNSFK